MKHVTKLNEEYAAGDNGKNICIFAYFEDADGVHQNTRQGSVTLDDGAIMVLKKYLMFDELEYQYQPPVSKYTEVQIDEVLSETDN